MKRTQARTPLWAIARPKRRQTSADGGTLTVVGNSWNPYGEAPQRHRDEPARPALVGAYYCG